MNEIRSKLFVKKDVELKILTSTNNDFTASF